MLPTGLRVGSKPGMLARRGGKSLLRLTSKSDDRRPPLDLAPWCDCWLERLICDRSGSRHGKPFGISDCGISPLVLSQPSNGSFVLLVHSYDISTERRA